MMTMMMELITLMKCKVMAMVMLTMMIMMSIMIMMFVMMKPLSSS